MAPDKGRILVVDDEESIRFTFRNFLEDEGYEVATAVDYDSAMRAVSESRFDLVYADIILGGRTGIDLLRDAKRSYPALEVILITGAPSVESASEALRLGALDYIVKPVRQDTLLRTAAMAFKHMALNTATEAFRLNLEAIFRSVRDVILTVDDELHVVEINDAAEDLCGISREEALGTSLESWDFACSEVCAQAMRDAIARGESVRVPDVDCSPGHVGHRVVDITATPLIRRDGSAIGGLVFVRDITRVRELERELREERAMRPIVGRGPRIQKVRAAIRALAGDKTPMLIRGAPGTGVDTVAHAVHDTGPWRDRPLVTVDCSNLTDILFERELCGHVRGAFPGADRVRIGRLERAHGGVILFREIGALSPSSQLLVLQILDTMEFTRLGDAIPVRVDVRVLASTSQDLRRMAAAGTFRRDLLERLETTVIELPPLTARREDIPLLVQRRLEQLNEHYGKNIVTVSNACMDLFMRSDWPQNCRQLDRVMERAYLVCGGRTISDVDLPQDFLDAELGRGGGAVDTSWLGDAPGVLPLREIERRYLEWAVATHTGERAELADKLGMSPRTLYRRLRELRDDDDGSSSPS
jgi:PAS domain S-box-containing protein